MINYTEKLKNPPPPIMMDVWIVGLVILQYFKAVYRKAGAAHQNLYHNKGMSTTCYTYTVVKLHINQKDLCWSSYHDNLLILWLIDFSVVWVRGWLPQHYIAINGIECIINAWCFNRSVWKQITPFVKWVLSRQRKWNSLFFFNSSFFFHVLYTTAVKIEENYKNSLRFEYKRCI